ncbi:hypothetical protein F4861DRAFT_544538 [Xylaria intraflava]|nr:hypothetical protein F4861DRAFT_544538 [Xylaria intraflava]
MATNRRHVENERPDDASSSNGSVPTTIVLNESPTGPPAEPEITEPVSRPRKPSNPPLSSNRTRHSSVSGVNAWRHGRPVPPIIVNDPDDAVAMKRARNSLRTRRFRGPNDQRMNELEEKIINTPGGSGAHPIWTDGPKPHQPCGNCCRTKSKCDFAKPCRRCVEHVLTCVYDPGASKFTGSNPASGILPTTNGIGIDYGGLQGSL